MLNTYLNTYLGGEFNKLEGLVRNLEVPNFIHYIISP